MKIEKDDREWKVILELSNKDCPYLFYPVNIHGCLLKKDTDNEYCNKDNCMFVKKEFKGR